MAYVTNITTVITYDLDGTTNIFNIPFEYLSRSFVVITLIGADRKILAVVNDYTFLTTTSIQTNTTWSPSSGYEQIEIRRQTSATERLVDFQNGSVLRATDLNVSQIQSMHIAEEARDLVSDTIGTDNDGNLDARGRRIINVADGIDPGDVVTMRQEASWANSTLNNSNNATAKAAAAAASATQSANSATQAGTYLTSVQHQVELAEEQVSLATEQATIATDQATIAISNAASAHADAQTATEQAAIATDEASKLAEFNDVIDRINSVAVAEVGDVEWHHSRSYMKQGCVAGDGQLLQRSVYPDLWSKVQAGTVPVVAESVWQSDVTKRGSYTTGDGSTTFRVPDYNGATSGSIAAPVLRGDSGVSSSTIQRSAAPNITSSITNQILFQSASATGALVISSQSINLQAAATTPANIGGSLITFDASRSSVVYGRDSVTEIRMNSVVGCYVIHVFGIVYNPGEIDVGAMATQINTISNKLDANTPLILTWTDAIAQGWITVSPSLDTTAIPFNLITIYSNRIEVTGVIRRPSGADMGIPVTGYYTIIKLPTGKTNYMRPYSPASLTNIKISGTSINSAMASGGYSSAASGALGSGVTGNHNFSVSGSGPTCAAVIFNDIYYLT